MLLLTPLSAGAMQQGRGAFPDGQVLDTIWALLTAFLIFLMQAGLMLVEAGSVQAKNAGHVVMKNISTLSIGSMVFLLIGYGLMFGKTRFGLFGASGFFLRSMQTGGDGIDNRLFAGLIFQVVLAGTAATIASGALAERTKFIGSILYSLMIGGLIYPVAGHWMRGGGWLSRLGMTDFAGATLVHSLAGWVSLAGVIVLGPRIGRYDHDRAPVPLPGHNLPLVALGTFIMWLGWFGLTGGGILSAHNPAAIGLISGNTLLAAMGGVASIMSATWLFTGKPDISLTLNGILAGLVTSSATAALVSPGISLLVGAVGGLILGLSVEFFEKIRLDDPVSALSIHGINGLWGTLAVGLFARAQFSMNSLGIPLNGLFFGGGWKLLAVQAVGAAAVFAWGFGVSLAMFLIVDKTIGLRVPAEEETRGLDYSAYRICSYPLCDEFHKKQDLIFTELKRVRELSILHEISQSMHSLNLEEILHLILQGVTHSIGFDRVRLYLINEKENILECRMAVGIEQEKIKTIALPLDSKGSVLAKVVSERKAYIIQDARNDPRVNRELKTLFNLRSFVAVPLQGRDRVMGAITADYILSDKMITKEKVDSLITFANQAGLAIENAKLYQELRLFNEELEERVRKATEDLKKTQEQLIQSSRLSALGQLSAGVAHEIRNPLTSIRILIHSLMERLSPEDIRRDDIEVIENEIERINQIIKQFLDFARPSKPKMERVDLNRLIADTLLLLSHELMEQEVEVDQNLVPLPCTLADREQMRQIFLNLILNAMQAMPGGGRLKVSTAFEESQVRISFQDDGQGIPESIRAKLFEPFFTTKEEGIGLGLSITKRIIEDHQGKIEVESAEGKGATFSVILPLASYCLMGPHPADAASTV
ncbi:MAG: ammonium transporter [bacterium]